MLQLLIIVTVFLLVGSPFVFTGIRRILRLIRRARDRRDRRVVTPTYRQAKSDSTKLNAGGGDQGYSSEPGSIGLQTVMQREDALPAIDRTVPTTSYGSSADSAAQVSRGLERINRLPPLKRAIVLSEILSRPVGER